MGKKQCESYLKFKAFTSTEFDIMRSIHKLPHFNVNKRLEVKRLTDPLQNVIEFNPPINPFERKNLHILIDSIRHSDQVA